MNDSFKISRHPATPAAWRVAVRRVGLDVLISIASVAVTFVVLYGSIDSARIVPYSAAAGIVTLITGFFLRLYRISARYMSARELIFPATAILITSIAVGLLHASSFYRGQTPSPLSFPVVFFLFNSFLWFASRAAARMIVEMAAVSEPDRRSGHRLIIIGAGDAGSLACRELQRLTAKRPVIVGFVDDDPSKHSMVIHGNPVLGTIEDLPDLAKRLRITDALVAIPSASGEQMRRIVSACQNSSLEVRTLPSFEDLIQGRRPILGMAREIRVEDLLRRKAHDEIEPGQMSYLVGQSVLVTGGGGSIGSELVRTVARQDPSALVLLGKGENSIFEVDQELKSLGHSMAVPFIADVRDPQSINNAFEKFRPSIVFHAAAHKHVPLMEAVPIEAIRNNIFGTLNVAEAAIRNGTRKFILVSTDKAVNPTNVMGATKRVAEMVVSAMAGRSETDFAAVRFGNVLGSRGSLIPILKKQIERGGPITITHPDMTRYFMTIPEAAQLIMQAGSLGSKGDIFVLDMGEPVRIMDIASDLVRLNGLEVGRDIEIRFIGVRPGEKMYEELSYNNEQVAPCEVAKIMRVSRGNSVDWSWLKEQLMELDGYCKANDSERARKLLLDLAWGSAMAPTIGLRSESISTTS